MLQKMRKKNEIFQLMEAKETIKIKINDIYL